MGLEKRKQSDMGAEKDTNSQQTLRAHPVLVLSVVQRAERRRPREPTVGLGTQSGRRRPSSLARVDAQAAMDRKQC